ncbi:TPA: TraK family protein [Legionella pneumophila]|nr:conjugal transfer protein TraK [Legionella pneumophila]HAU1873422.1 conjugal transfer protein TraK [Legionella pneumophila]HBD7078986.1 TraK family protein [Legionella pneumophila]HCC0691375.1 TraK family protein [Legionella pneumophila]
MKKSLAENITSSKQSQHTTNTRKHKVEFLAMREDISEALEKGWSITIIWETLREEGSFTATYNTFRLYVLKYLNGQKSGYSQKDANVQQPKRLAENQDKEKKPTTMPLFNFNPIPNLKELL